MEIFREGTKPIKYLNPQKFQQTNIYRLIHCLPPGVNWTRRPPLPFDETTALLTFLFFKIKTTNK